MEIKKLIEKVKGTPERVLLKSRKNCHAEGVSSIMLRQSEYRGNLRMFMVWPGSPLIRNMRRGVRDLVVGIHDHHYNIVLEGVSGVLRNYLFKEGVGIGFRGVNELSYTLDGNGRPRIAFEKLNGVRLLAENEILAGQRCMMSDCALHTVGVEAFTSWIVEEGIFTKPRTKLFSHTVEPRCSRYEEFESKDQVIQHVEEYYSWLGEV